MAQKEKIVVGFSGGVDSTAVIKKLQSDGYEPIAVFLKMSKNQDLEKVQEMAKKLGVNLMIKDISNIFGDCIVGNFIKEYQNNRTPNPCVKCNYEIKFKFLLKIADELKIEKVATGHYARIKKEGDKFKLLKGLDNQKDQSYFLYRLTQKELARIIFPLGDQLKSDIKKEALSEKLFEKIEESQDICFLSAGERVESFLKKNVNEESGEIQNEKGEILGEHQGLAYYTQGQRKGLDLPGGPYYVIGKEEKENILFVSKNKEHPNLINNEIYLEQVNWISDEPDLKKRYEFKSRYRSSLTSGRIEKENESWKIILDKSQWAVAPGQSLVAYFDDKVIGGGIIKTINNK